MEAIFEYKPAINGYIHNFRHDLPLDENRIRDPIVYFETFRDEIRTLIRSHVGEGKAVIMWLSLYVDMEKEDGTEDTPKFTPKKR